MKELTQNTTKVKESNARTIKWSDGSLSLQVGAELFDISATVDHSGVLSSSSAAAPAGAPKPAAPQGLSVDDVQRGHGLTYLTAEHAYQGLIEAQASVYGTLTFRPTTLQSNTHRRLAGSIAGRYVKGRGIKMAELPDEDPEKKKLEREKEELARAKKLKKKAQASSGVGARKGARRATRFSDGEGDEDAPQSSTRRGGLAYTDDEEDSDGGGFIEHDTDGSDAEDEPRSAKRSKRPSPRYSEDEMDAAEARIEAEERRRKERKLEGKKSVVEEPAPAPRRRLVVESDEEE